MKWNEMKWNEMKWNEMKNNISDKQKHHKKSIKTGIFSKISIQIFTVNYYQLTQNK